MIEAIQILQKIKFNWVLWHSSIYFFLKMTACFDKIKALVSINHNLT